MEIKIKLIDPTLPMPEFQTSGSVAFDIYSRKNITINPKEITLIPSNLIIETPEDHFLMIVARSSSPIKKGLTLANGMGIIDQDYCGPDDEILAQVYNLTDQPVTVSKGERIAQGIFVKITKNVDWEQVDEINPENRGGHGSTG